MGAPGALASRRFEDLHLDVLGNVSNLQAPRLATSQPPAVRDAQVRHETLRALLIRKEAAPTRR